jgi:hypothetical protein
VGSRLCLAVAWAAWTIKSTLNRNDEGPGFIRGLFFLLRRTNSPLPIVKEPCRRPYRYRRSEPSPTRPKMLLGPCHAECSRRLSWPQPHPKDARKPRDAADTTGTSVLADDTAAMNRDIAAPTENDTADVNAASTGRAVVISEMPSSSRACAPKASFAISCWATCRARS